MSSDPQAFNKKVGRRERLWCQMCRKQCRDQAAFDSHCQSRAHVESMERFSRNPDRYLKEFSDDFEAGFLEALKEKHGLRRASVNVVYNQYVARDSQGTRLNATRWSSVTAFVRHLDTKGLARVSEEEDPSAPGGVSLFIQLVDSRGEELERAAEQRRRKDDSSRASEAAALQREYEMRAAAVASAAAAAGPTAAPLAAAAPLARSEAPAASFALAAGGGGGHGGGADEPNAFKAARKAAVQEESAAKRARVAGGAAAPLPPSLPPAAPAAPADEPWVRKGVAVRIVNKSLSGGAYYKKKGVVEGVQDGGFTARVRVTDPPALVALDQQHLETVVPKIGGAVRVLRGAAKGVRGTLRKVVAESFSAVVEPDDGGVSLTLSYEDFSKVAAVSK